MRRKVSFSGEARDFALGSQTQYLPGKRASATVSCLSQFVCSRLRAAEICACPPFSPFCEGQALNSSLALIAKAIR